MVQLQERLKYLRMVKPDLIKYVLHIQTVERAINHFRLNNIENRNTKLRSLPIPNDMSLAAKLKLVLKQPISSARPWQMPTSNTQFMNQEIIQRDTISNHDRIIILFMMAGKKNQEATTIITMAVLLFNEGTSRTDANGRVRN